MKLSVVIPVFNEEATISEILKQVSRSKLPRGVTREIVVVNDGSHDKTSQILKGIKGIKKIEHKTNLGKGAAIQTALKNITGDFVIIQDADLEYDPNDYAKLIEPILKGQTEVVYGTRLKNYPFHLIGRKRTPLLAHYIGNKLLTIVTNVLYGSNVTDMETCYKVITRKALKSFTIKANRFEFEPEITAKLLKNGYKIVEVPIKVKPRGYEEGKKITWKDGFGALLTLIKYKFND